MVRPTDKRALARVPSGARVACVRSTYHAEITGEMSRAAHATLRAAGLAQRGWREVLVPGAFELPLVARALARRADVDAVLAFGLVLRGETEHDRHIAAAVSQGLMAAGLETGKPILFGVLTCNTLEQARARASARGLDKGGEVARAAIGALRALAAVAPRARSQGARGTRGARRTR
jgi:6,7-dimethyl-8-ribityllumazine synthase